MIKAKILIVSQGGVIQNIMCTDPDIQVVTIDYDSFEDHTVPFEARVEDAVRLQEVETFVSEWAETLKGELSKNEAAVKARLAELDKEFTMSDDLDASDIFGNSYEDYAKAAAANGYILKPDKFQEAKDYMENRWDNSFTVSGQEQLESLVEDWANELDLLKYEEVFDLDEVEPDESGDYPTNLGFAYFDLKDSVWTQAGEEVEPIVWSYEHEEHA